MADQIQKPAQEAPAAAAAAKPAGEAKPEAVKQTNCPNCNKPIKRLTRYYRDGIFYCARKCWRITQEKAKTKSSEE